jgi:hypothetical protein
MVEQIVLGRRMKALHKAGSALFTLLVALLVVLAYGSLATVGAAS